MDEKIKQIKELLLELDYPASYDVFPDCSPSYKSIGDNVVALVERLYIDGVDVVVYAKDMSVDEFKMSYIGLPEDLLAEILEALQTLKDEQE